MFESIAALRADLDNLDPETYSAADAGKAVRVLAELERQLSSARVRLASVASRSREVWQSQGERSAADWLARQTGTSVFQAGHELDLAERLSASGSATDAFNNGKLSLPQARKIASAVEADPSSGAELAQMAESASMAELNQACLDIQARADDDRARDERAHRRRGLFSSSCGDGTSRISVQGPPDDIAHILAAVSCFREPVIAEMRKAGEFEGPHAIDYDAFSLLVRHSTEGMSRAEARERHSHDACAEGCEHTAEDSETDHAPGTDEPIDTPEPDPTQDDYRRKLRKNPELVVARVDYTALLRGRAAEGEIAQIAGQGPVPVTTLARAILGGAKLAIIVTDHTDRPISVAHIPARRSRALRQHLRDKLGYEPPSRIQPGPDWWTPTKVIIRVDHSAVRGPDAATDDPFLQAIADHASLVADLSHGSRKPTACQRTALQWRDPTCRVKGCTATARLEIDHHARWSDTHCTSTEDLGHLCCVHHVLKDRYGYELEPGPGKRRLLPPQRERAKAAP